MGVGGRGSGAAWWETRLGMGSPLGKELILTVVGSTCREDSPTLRARETLISLWKVQAWENSHAALMHPKCWTESRGCGSFSCRHQRPHPSWLNQKELSGSQN